MILKPSHLRSTKSVPIQAERNGPLRPDEEGGRDHVQNTTFEKAKAGELSQVLLDLRRMDQTARRQGVAWTQPGRPTLAGRGVGGPEEGGRPSAPTCRGEPLRFPAGLRFRTPAPMASVPLPVSSRPKLPLIQAPTRQPLCRACGLDLADWLRASAQWPQPLTAGSALSGARQPLPTPHHPAPS